MINNNFDLYLHFETYFKNNCIHFIQNDIYTDENDIKFINYDKFKQLLNLNELKYNTKCHDSRQIEARQSDSRIPLCERFLSATY